MKSRLRTGAACVAGAVLTTAAAACGSDASGLRERALPAAVTAEATATSAPERTATAAEAIAVDAANPSTPTPRPARRILSPADRLSFTTLERSLGGRSGLAISGIGPGQPVQAVGTLRTGVAWSTSKVPVAMAIESAGLAAGQAKNLTAAITASDNAAAEALWSALGTPQDAAAASDAMLRAGGDRRTTTQSRRLRGAAYTAFGQTSWALTDQTRFAAGMACSDAGRSVLALMQRIVPSERWGLSAIGTKPAFKGGWGPGTKPGVAGGYLDRQVGIVRLGPTPVAVSIMTAPADGAHATGTAHLTAIAQWLRSHADAGAVPAATSC